MRQFGWWVFRWRPHRPGIIVDTANNRQTKAKISKNKKKIQQLNFRSIKFEQLSGKPIHSSSISISCYDNRVIAYVCHFHFLFFTLHGTFNKPTTVAVQCSDELIMNADCHLSQQIKVTLYLCLFLLFVRKVMQEWRFSNIKCTFYGIFHRIYVFETICSPFHNNYLNNSI